MDVFGIKVTYYEIVVDGGEFGKFVLNYCGNWWTISTTNVIGTLLSIKDIAQDWIRSVIKFGSGVYVSQHLINIVIPA